MLSQRFASLLGFLKESSNQIRDQISKNQDKTNLHACILFWVKSVAPSGMARLTSLKLVLLAVTDMSFSLYGYGQLHQLLFQEC
jgi:hypothetical protein